MTAGRFCDTIIIKKGLLHTADYFEGHLQQAESGDQHCDIPPPKFLVQPDSHMMTADSMVHVLEQMGKDLGVTLRQRHLLLLDGHESHLADSVINKAKELGFDIHLLPGAARLLHLYIQ